MGVFRGVFVLKNIDLGTPSAIFSTPQNAQNDPFLAFWRWIANLCLLFFNLQKGRLLYIHPIGRSVGWCHHYFSFSTYILRIRTTVRDFTWSSLVVNSGQHCDCEYCQEIVKIVPELAEKRKEKRIFRQRWFVWGQHNYHTSCRWSVLIKKTFFKTKVSAVNMIRGIDF